MIVFGAGDSTYAAKSEYVAFSRFNEITPRLDQVAQQRGVASVVGIDLLPIDEIAAAKLMVGDFTDPAMSEQVATLLGGPVGLVLADMAPNTTGHAPTDRLCIMGLAELALGFATDVLAPGGAFVAKLFQGGSERQMLSLLKTRFSSVRHAKSPASRKESSELYVVVSGFR
jgi:23S rRNA (uridine2552-2'-O)-methyltransferase